MNLLETILETTYTLHDLKHRVRVLRSYLELKLFGNESADFPAEDMAWLSSLPQDFFSQFQKEKLTSIFTSLEQQINQINPLTIYLAFKPEVAEIAQIYSWVRQNLTTKVVIETKFDPSLIGGVALVWNGVYKDYSLKAKIESQNPQLMEEFKKSWR